ncbi:hypothetical protein HC256_009737 [Beauveria bassiana]|nr:hypothetical protein HC256_009737 [Beauveria bassiana]
MPAFVGRAGTHMSEAMPALEPPELPASSHYKPGGPVIVIAGGEVTAEYHKPLLANSRRRAPRPRHLGPAALPGAPLLRQQFPPCRTCPAPTIDSFMTEQAVAGAAFFAQHARFPGLKDPGPDRGAHAIDHLRRVVPGEGGGAFAAIARKLHPEGDCGPAMANITYVVDTALFSRDGGKAGNGQGIVRVESSAVSNGGFRVEHCASVVGDAGRELGAGRERYDARQVLRDPDVRGRWRIRDWRDSRGDGGAAGAGRGVGQGQCDDAAQLCRHSGRLLQPEATARDSDGADGVRS